VRVGSEGSEEWVEFEWVSESAIYPLIERSEAQEMHLIFAAACLLPQNMALGRGPCGSVHD